MKTAQRRELERERCAVRKLQKEREVEEGVFDDKESFVTPAYMKKLEEIRYAEAKEKMEAAVEGIMCNFYLSHFLCNFIVAFSGIVANSTLLLLIEPKSIYRN